ncbi:MAG: bifunctional phosphopantothenoylcysteine decarboxylase/phosphopantothenate--cysteine ligase CoaBC [Sulfurovum sp.]|nr:bifunctional phosphopantothenoylcysteine decarboxylase/phosphopantothenate--cysteine ligase CoaBC [Sulfurovum sp.]MCB4745978.1 bifunctional phosphopantothenoylcysteine decarboxylase/phosphopantothenate--cysteine ligase CoaBC [Sulfurovum sp.]MCB4748400.1 bifunctional phosphopantothenoylcysteine decarboxylase/phosphopantothenate--cysteine ligase CoaBC [Sulfurovum sp.]MCB4748783.1 bifunctional phosphopantothenoylcysteine decarboxylase/phosphopantothenate--cysteine ligase CoaBC [Sulfurovum sp.]M
MQIDLTGKSVLLGVTGSISAYKACDIARLFIKAGANIHVVMSPSAERFVSALSFEALTRNPVLTAQSESWSSDLNHIEIGKKCDVFIIAPATANSINKLSKGIADNILLQTALAFTRSILIAPAANTQMLSNHYTVGSLKMLKVNDYIIIEPQEKQLACGDTGNGALAEPKEVFFETAKAMFKDDFWSDRRVVVTGGGTREKIDEVRYISNYSSGKMGKALALALYLHGADVCYITTKDKEGLPSNIYTLNVESAQEMLDYTVDAVRVSKKGIMSKASMNSTNPRMLIQKTPFLFMAAAVSDYKPTFSQNGKIKKEILGKTWQLALIQTPDILSSLNKDGIQTVAFKAEMDAQHGLDNAHTLLHTKKVNAVCHNLLLDSSSFGTEENEITFITPEHTVSLGKRDKLTLAIKILNEAKKLADD